MPHHYEKELKKPKSPPKKVKAPSSDKKMAQTTKEVMAKHEARQLIPIINTLDVSWFPQIGGIVPYILLFMGIPPFTRWLIDRYDDDDGPPEEG